MTCLECWARKGFEYSELSVFLCGNLEKKVKKYLDACEILEGIQRDPQRLDLGCSCEILN